MNLDLEKEYSPSLYTKRFQNFPKPDEEVINNFIRVSENATTLARQQYKTRLDVRYGGTDDNQLLDIYFKDQEEGTPIFVYIHGGFWQMLDKSSSGPIVHTLIKHNYRLLLVDYNLCPQITLQQLTEQICNFYKWLKVYAEKTKAPKISISGHSAGGHLNCLIFKDEFLEPLKRLQLLEHVFLISGVYDLRELIDLKCVNANNILSLDNKKAEELSPLLWSYNKELVEAYRKQGVKFHVLVAENDTGRFIKQSKEYYDKLKELQLEVFYKEFELYDHFDIIEDYEKENSPISRYICESLNLI